MVDEIGEKNKCYEVQFFSAKVRYTEIRPSLDMYIEVKFVGYKVHQCSVVEKKNFAIGMTFCWLQ